MTQIVPSTDAGIARAAAALRAGEPVVIPTETVYGLAAHALSPDAVASVFAAKGRPADDPLIVHVAPDLLGEDYLAGLKALKLVGDLTPAQATTADLLLDGCWPGPLTVVLPKGDAVPASVTSRLPTVAIRMPAHPIARAVIEAAGVPLVAPSANRFGRISPTTAEAAQSELDGRVPWVVDGGRCEVGVESTVVRIDADGSVGVLRPGLLGAEALARNTGGRTPYKVAASEGIAGSPGRLLRHYAPHTALVVVKDGPATWSDARWADLARRGVKHVAWIAWTGSTEADEALLAQRLGCTVTAATLTAGDDAAEAAHQLYAVLRTLDDLDTDLLVLQLGGTGPLAEAIADRVSRAAHGTRALTD